MTFEEALKMANEYFKSMDNSTVTSALDAETHWIFYGGQPAIGAAGLKINKLTGQSDDFILPDDENFEFLDKAVKINF